MLGRWEGASYYGSLGEKLFTQQQVDAMCEDAFNAAKKDAAGVYRVILVVDRCAAVLNDFSLEHRR